MIDKLFLEYLRRVDAAYAAFSLCEADLDDKQLLAKAYAEKDSRNDSLNQLMAALLMNGYTSLVEYCEDIMYY